MRIAVVAPSSRFEPGKPPRRVTRDRGARRIPTSRSIFHPQCFLAHNHFAGRRRRAPRRPGRGRRTIPASTRSGSRAAATARAGSRRRRSRAWLGAAARAKAWLGYSDAGFLLAGMYRAGFANVAHGPMPQDVMREGGEAAVERALAWLAAGAAEALEPRLERRAGRMPRSTSPCSAMLLGTPLEPDLAGHVLLLEEVSEHLYATRPGAVPHQRAAPMCAAPPGIRLGRVSDDPAQRSRFRRGARRRSSRAGARAAGIPYLGRADIGHDSANKVVPFGLRERRLGATIHRKGGERREKRRFHALSPHCQGR